MSTLKSHLPWLAALLLLAAAAALYDRQLSAWLAGCTQARPGLLRLARLVSDWGNYVFYAGFGLALVVGLARGERALVRLGLAYFATLLIFSFLAVRLLKIGVGRPRPYVGADLGCRPLSLEARYNSFPSGHTSDAFAAVVPTLRWGRPGLLPGLLKGAVVSLAAAISASRVMLGQHYATDVVAGAALALGGSLLVTRLLERWLPTQAGGARG
jgi:undecaprenyl-diphosphatase